MKRYDNLKTYPTESKTALKEALAEIFNEHRGLFHEIFADLLEEFVMPAPLIAKRWRPQ
jgi:hypothetical protein